MHAVPPWLSGVRPALESAVPDWFATFTPPPNPARRPACGDHHVPNQLPDRVVQHREVQPFALAAGALTQAVTGTVGLSAAFDGRLDDPRSFQAVVNLQNVDLSVGGLPVALQLSLIHISEPTRPY